MSVSDRLTPDEWQFLWAVELGALTIDGGPNSARRRFMVGDRDMSSQFFSCRERGLIAWRTFHAPPILTAKGRKHL